MVNAAYFSGQSKALQVNDYGAAADVNQFV